MTTTRLILVRHAETTANQEQRWYGALDAPLTPRGERQVEATARRFAQWTEDPVDAIYSSPLPRARRTAAAIAQSLDLELLIDDGLREFSIGDWEGRTYRELMETERLWERWAEDPTFAPPNGESPLTFGRRAVEALKKLAEAHACQSIVAVTHGGVISCALDAWLGNQSGEWIRWDPPNCAVSALEWNGERWHGKMVNDISHLPPDAVAAEKPAYQQSWQ